MQLASVAVNLPELTWPPHCCLESIPTGRLPAHLFSFSQPPSSCCTAHPAAVGHVLSPLPPRGQ